MDEKTLKALKGSIKKWERIVRRTDAGDKGTDNCPLCTLFYDDNCAGCPVREFSQVPFCSKTPYEKWINHAESHMIIKYNGLRWAAYRIPHCPECLRLARAERDFLKSLLPKDS